MTRRARLFGALFIVALIAVALAAFVFIRLNTRTYPQAVPSGTLAFTALDSGQWNIAILPDSDSLTYLTPEDAYQNYFPSWDFAGERINFLSSRGSGGTLVPTQVYPDGSNLRALDILSAVTAMVFENRLDWDPSYSASGTLLWSSLRDFNLEIYARSGETAPVRLTSHPARDWFAAWSPDETRIAFASDRDGNENIYVMDADGGNVIQVTFDAADDFRPSWSLDGQTLLFLSADETSMARGEFALYTIALADIDAQTGAPPLTPFAADAVFEGGSAYAADGRQIAYMSSESGSFQIYVMDVDADGTLIRESARQLTTAAGAMFPVWQP